VVIQFRQNSCQLLGDTHSMGDTLAMLRRSGIRDNMDVVFLGDGGEGFNGRGYDERMLDEISKVCCQRNIRLYCIRGNHSNPSCWVGGGYDRPPSVFFVPDYTDGVFPNGTTCLMVGGGLSIDRYTRAEGIDYWAAEITIYQKMEKKYDILFSHDAPEHFNHSTASLKDTPYGPYLLVDHTLSEDCLLQRNVISQIAKDIECRHIFSGHFHNKVRQKIRGVEYRCLAICEVAYIEVPLD
jgi:hypothetical protein